MITKQKAFNKSLIDQETQVIFLDEAYAGLLEPDDWKVLRVDLSLPTENLSRLEL